MICNKRGFISWKSANAALKRIKRGTDGKSKLKSYYRCVICGYWHLSKVKHTPENVKKHSKIQKQKWLQAEAEYWEQKLKEK